MIKIKPLVSPKNISDTLNRMGVASDQTKTIFTTATLIKSPSETWYVAHFKELLHAVDSQVDTVNEEDICRLGAIINLLIKFNLVEAEFQRVDPINLKVLKKTDLVENGGEWNCVKKFTPSQTKMEKVFAKLGSI